MDFMKLVCEAEIQIYMSSFQILLKVIATIAARYNNSLQQLGNNYFQLLLISQSFHKEKHIICISCQKLVHLPTVRLLNY